MNRSISTTLAGIILAILVSTTSVHSQTNGASVQGTITDQTSVAIPGVKVTATNRDTGTSSSTITDANGKYTFSGLPDGDYAFSAFLPGFSVNEVHKPIAKDSAVQQNFVLKIVGLSTAAIQIVPLPDPPNDAAMVIHPNGSFR